MSNLGEAVAALGRYLLTSTGQQLQHVHGYPGDLPLLATHELETLGSVMERTRYHDLPLVLAVYFPERHGAEAFSFLHVQAETNPAMRRDWIGRTSTMGPFVDALTGRGTVTCDCSNRHESLKLRVLDTRQMRPTP